MNKELESFGYKSISSFLRDINKEKFIEIEKSGWKKTRFLLKHIDCPIEIREKYILSPIWYQRYVAYFAKNAPYLFFEQAKNDPDKRIKHVYEKAKRFGWFQGEIGSLVKRMVL